MLILECSVPYLLFCYVFFFNDTPTTEIYTLSLHDALPICGLWWRLQSSCSSDRVGVERVGCSPRRRSRFWASRDRKSTRLNSSHVSISYAVFCLKKKRRWTCRCPCCSCASRRRRRRRAGCV